MSKWKCEICGNEFENFHAQGFDNKIYCPLCYFKKENQELKEKYLNAVAHYETTMFEKEQLNSLVNSCQEEIRQLKKQLEEKENIACNWKDSCLENAGKIEKLENQQKKFIKFLEYNYKETQDIWYIKILQKYKEIIGDVKNENNNLFV